MNTNNTVPIALRIERDGKLLLQSILAAELQGSFADLILREFDLPHGVAQIETVYAGAQSFEQKELFKIALTSTIADSIMALGKCTKVLCILKSEITERPSAKNVFDKMMQGAVHLKLPDKRPEQDGRSSIYNRLIVYLEKHKVGFRVFQKSEMEFFMTTIATTLWQLDGHWHKFSVASNVSRPPEALHFVPPNQEAYRALYHGTHKKKVLPQMKSDELIVNHDKLEQLATKHFLKSETWSVVLGDVLQLKKAISDYIRHITRACDSKASAQLAVSEVRENRVLKKIPPCVKRDEITKLCYKQLEQHLSELPPYSEVNVVFFAPVDRRLKHKYIAGLQLSFPVNLYRSFSPNGTFIWRVATEESTTESAIVINRVEQDLEIRLKADKVKRLSEEYSGTAKWTSDKVLEFVSAASDDDIEPADSTQAGYKLLLEEGYEIPEVLSLESEAAASSSGKFTNFWKATEKVLAANDYTVSEERRHGDTTWISPLCVSLNDLVQKCEAEMENMYPGSEQNFVPSYEYFRLQFVPRNSNSEVVKRYYGRFNVKFGLQKRTLHKHHVDQHFGAKQFQYLKVMAGAFSDHALIFFLDDKASIPVGFEDAPVSATRRQRRVLMAGLKENGLNAMDHDNIPQHIIPSIAIKLVPPKELTDSWYQGQPTITLKDAIFEPSTAFRHAAEVVQNLTLADLTRPMMFFGTDGGPDHNVTSIQVILSYMALFFELDLDFLAAARTPPNFSVINPAERFMSVANIALVGVSLTRNHLGSDEKKVRSLMSKQQWRDAQQKHPDVNYHQLALDGTKDARSLLTERFKRLSYKGEKVLIGQPASSSEIDDLKQLITNRWPELDFSQPLLKANVMNIPAMKDFVSEHVCCTKYTVQIKKCKNEACQYHQRMRLSTDDFDKINWLPSPEIAGDKFLNFADVFGREPTDKDVPSANTVAKDRVGDVPRAPFPLAYTRVRLIVRCSECEYPRLMYTKYNIDGKKKKTRMEEYFEEKMFVCGADVDEYPELYENKKLACYDPISLHYYQAGPKLSGYYAQCAKCLSKSVTLAPNKILLCKKCIEQTPRPANVYPVYQKRGRGRPSKK